MPKVTEEPPFYVLDEDKLWARNRIAELEKAIQDLGPEFNIALNQSNETWHDNAPFDALRDTQALMVAEMQNLKEILFAAALRVPKSRPGRAGVGSLVTVLDGSKQRRYRVVGDWSYRTGHQHGQVMVISRRSPIGAALMDRQVGETVTLKTNKKSLKITAIDQP